MSVFSELLPKLKEISNAYIRNFEKDLKEALDNIDKLEEEILNEKKLAKDTLKDKLVLKTLQSIDEDEDENFKTPEEKPKRKLSIKAGTDEKETNNKPKRTSNKRNKSEVDDMSSPEVDKRQKRTASVVAQSNISKQVNVNLAQKLRREETDKKKDKNEIKLARVKSEDKENIEPVPVIKIKEEKISLPLEPMDLEEALPIDFEINQEVKKDEIAMPPPIAPISKSRKAVTKANSGESSVDDSVKRRTTRTRKQAETSILSATSARVTRASSRATQHAEAEVKTAVETRPERARTKKVTPETSVEIEKETRSTQDNGIEPLADKPRPKRTRKGQKAVDKDREQEETVLKQEDSPPAEEPVPCSPVLPVKSIPKRKADARANVPASETASDRTDCLRETLVLEPDGADGPGGERSAESDAVGRSPEVGAKAEGGAAHVATLNTTVVLPCAVYSHAQVTPKNVRVMNETVVKEKHDAVDSDEPQAIAMDATVVLDRLPQSNLTDDDSLLTEDDDSPAKTPTKSIPPVQPSSAVKEKVQQFEELASSVTRTKTRAKAKKKDSLENQTPPDKVSKVIVPPIPTEVLSKMNSMIFNGKSQQSSSAVKATASHIPTLTLKQTSSSSKLNSINRAREAAEEFQKREKEDAKKKKEAMLEAKREMQKKKREEKMAAAAAARDLAEKERRAAMEASLKERMEKQAQADLGKLERLKEVERKKHELARKVAETEERRKAEEHARLQRLADEQRKAEAARKKQREEAEEVKKEAAIMAKEIERRQKEYLEKQMKLKNAGSRTTPVKGHSQAPAQDPVHMCDGFQYLKSDSEDDERQYPIPAWSTSKQREHRLRVQALVPEVDVVALFSVRPHCPDLRAIFPGIERACLKRTSSAVWRTPPADVRDKK